MSMQMLIEIEDDMSNGKVEIDDDLKKIMDSYEGHYFTLTFDGFKIFIQMDKQND